MALFNNNSTSKEDVVTQAAQQQQNESNEDFLSEFAGKGLENLSGSAVSTAYLGIVQPDSSAVEEGHQPATWLNSATRENLGNVVSVIPVAVEIAWIERDSQAPFNTVGRYPVNGVEVQTQPLPAGKRGFPKMINPATGNEVQELPIYALMLEHDLEKGVLFYSPTRGSMRTCKFWNTMLRSQRLPNGLLAPLFAYSWDLEVELIKKGSGNGKVIKDFAQFSKVSRGNLITKSLFQQSVQPVLASQTNLLTLAAPETSGDIED